MKLKQSHKILKFIWNYATIFYARFFRNKNVSIKLSFSPFKLFKAKLFLTYRHFPFLLPFVAVHVSRLSYKIAIRRAI